VAARPRPLPCARARAILHLVKRSANRVLPFALACVLGAAAAAFPQEESGPSAETQGGGVGLTIPALPQEALPLQAGLQADSIVNAAWSGALDAAERAPALGLAPLPAPASEVAAPASAPSVGPISPRSFAREAGSSAPEKNEPGKNRQASAAPRRGISGKPAGGFSAGQAAAQRPPGRETLLQALSAAQPDWSKTGNAGAAAAAQDDFEARAQLAPAVSAGVLRQGWRAVSGLVTEITGDSTHWDRQARLSADTMPYNFELENPRILRGVAEAAKQEALHGEEPGTRVVGSFSALKTVRQSYADCAVHAWYNNPALRPVRQALGYDDFLSLFEALTGVSVRSLGTSPEQEKMLMAELGYEIREIAWPSEDMLLRELRKNDGGVNVAIGWKAPRLLRPFDNEAGHEVVINGAYLEKGTWRFIVTDSNYATPQIYTYRQLSSLREFIMVSIFRAAGPDGKPLTDTALTARARRIKSISRGMRPPAPPESRFRALFKKILKSLFS